MRSEFIARLTEIAEEDDRVLLLTGDLGFSVLETFAERFPGRFVNVGVAEQNMIGLATGLADAGYIPYCYSIATFALLRPYEFIRNGPVAQGLRVRIVGTGGGFDYGHNGLTHFALEDIAVASVQPALTVIAPADPPQAVSALEVVHALDGPVYFRLGREGRPISELDGRFRLGHVEHLLDGADVGIIALGPMAHVALDAAALLRERNVFAAVASASVVNPAPSEDLQAFAARFPLVLTIEAHYRHGGLGSLVADVIAEHGLDCRLVRRCVERMPVGATGSPAHLHQEFGLTPEAVTDSVCAVLTA